MRAVADLQDLTILSGATNSNAVGILDDTITLTIYAPSALTGTITLQVEPSTAGTSFVALTSAGSDVTIGASKAVTIGNIGFRQIRVVSSGAEGADRTFKITKQIGSC